ncbi:MAG TPA: type II CAAX endopeptidase family protein [Candidatus Limnocylindrales bacterium]|nr:type II CAAX endopeptidase family protein [Candidatus Limnocylindrales bacterium]
MTFQDQLQSQGAEAASHLRWKQLFVGRDGLRAGWRLSIFFALIGLVLAGQFFLAGARVVNPEHIVITPQLLGANDAIVLLILGAVTWIMGKIERRKFSGYGLPLRKALGKEFWLGSLIGFITISSTLLGLFLLHDFRITGLALHGSAVFTSLAAWAIAFLLVGLFEEFAFRGYTQFTLASGMGFWPAAVVISGLFGLAHLIADPNENATGSAAVVLFGLLLCFFLRRTGNLWCAVGFHAAYDWGQTFFYGVPDSGIAPYHNLLSSRLSGPHWLSGGAVGPEASVVTPIVLLIVALIFNRYYPKDRFPIPRADSMPAAASAQLVGF